MSVSVRAGSVDLVLCLLLLVSFVSAEVVSVSQGLLNQLGIKLPTTGQSLPTSNPCCCDRSQVCYHYTHPGNLPNIVYKVKKNEKTESSNIV